MSSFILFVGLGLGGNLYAADEHDPNYALAFSGEKVANVQAPQQIAEGGEVTVLARVKINDKSGDKAILFSGAGWGRKGMKFFIRGENLRFQLGDGSNEAFKQEGTVPEGEWTLVGGMWKDGHLYHIVNDNILQTVEWPGGHYPNPDFDLHIGQILAPGDSVWSTMDGKIADVRIYDRALSEEEIHDIMIQPSTAGEDGLIGCWPMSEGVGNIVYDRSGHKNNGWIMGADWVEEGPEIVAEIPDTDVPLLIKHAVYENPAESVGVLLDVMKDKGEGPLVRMESLKVLEKAESPLSENTVLLLDILQDADDDEKIRIAAFDALNRAGASEEDMIPVLLEVIGNTHESDKIRLKSLDALGGLDVITEEEAAQVLVGVLEDTENSVEIRNAALAPLTKIDPDAEKIAAALVAILEDTGDSLEVRRNVPGALGELNVEAKSIATSLLTVLKDTEDALEVRRNVPSVLSRLDIEAEAIAPALLAVLKDTGDVSAVRREAIQSVAEAGPSMHRLLAADTEAVDALLETLVPQASPELRAVAARALEAVGVDIPRDATDWPMWRYDAARSAQTPVLPPETLHLQWVRELPLSERAWTHQWDDRGKLEFDVSYSPVVMGDKIFVPSNVNDSITAYSIENGTELWRFYTDGPVRLAPAAWRQRVYFISDDGHLYCVNSDDGELQWKFRAGPSDMRLLGNERIINFWAARGGPVVQGGNVYFAAGIFPLHGVFVYALDAESGEVVWVNDTTSSDYVRLPHGGARGYGGLSPQGYIAADDDRLVVASGRGQSPVFMDLHSGEVTDYSFRGSKGYGGYAVHSGGLGMKTNSMLAEKVKSVADQIEGNLYIETDRAGDGFIDRNLRDDPDALHVFYKLAARNKLFFTTECGRLYCFGPEEQDAVYHEHHAEPLEPQTDDWADVAAGILDELGEDKGYAMMLGAGSGDLMRELLTRSDLHLVVVENDPDRVLELRNELTAAVAYGRSGAAVIEADPATFGVQPYLFSLVVSEDVEAAGIDASDRIFGHILNRLRPYGGVAWLGASGRSLGAMVKAANSANTDGVSVQARSDRHMLFFRRGHHLFARRGGPLTGAGEWTHQYHDAKNTNLSRDDLARLPLGVLWYGGPNNHNILPRHSGGPRPNVSGGRQVFLGVETIAARCVYTGRELWEREFPGIGHHATDMGDQRNWEQGIEVYMSNIPGSQFIGSPFVTRPDSVYLRYGEKIHRLDSSTGETLAEFDLPGRSLAEIYPNEEVEDWGTMRVVGDYLVTTAEPHMFEDQQLGWAGYSGTSSRRIAVLDRFSGEVLWEKQATVGFRHNAIVASEERLYVIDGLSEKAIEHLARRGREPKESHRLYALQLPDGEEVWSTDSKVFGTMLVYSEDYDILVEGGKSGWKGGRARGMGPDDEPFGQTVARNSETGELLWQRGRFDLPGALKGQVMIPGHQGEAISLLTGETWRREQPHTGESSPWRYSRRYGCGTLNASEHLLLYRTGYAGYFDLEHDTGTGTFGGFRAGCTSNMIAADGVVHALDYTRTCTCSYALQTSLALVHMPGDANIEFWTRYDGDFRDPERHGINFGAPGRRVDVAGGGLVWHDEAGTNHRHPSAIRDSGDSIAWVAASVRETEGSINIEDLIDGAYTVRLHFAELNEGAAAGDRVFDVLIDGEVVLENFDIVSQTGGTLLATVRELSIVVEDATLSLELRGSNDSELPPAISGIELIAEKAL